MITKDGQVIALLKELKLKAFANEFKRPQECANDIFQVFPHFTVNRTILVCLLNIIQATSMLPIYKEQSIDLDLLHDAKATVIDLANQRHWIDSVEASLVDATFKNLCFKKPLSPEICSFIKITKQAQAAAGNFEVSEMNNFVLIIHNSLKSCLNELGELENGLKITPQFAVFQLLKENRVSNLHEALYAITNTEDEGKIGVLTFWEYFEQSNHEKFNDFNCYPISLIEIK